MKKFFITIAKTIIFFIGWAVLTAFMPDIQTNIPAYLRLWWEFIPLLLVILFSLVFVFLVEKRKIRIPVYKNFLKNLSIGLITGALWLGSVILILILTKTMHIESKNNISYLWIWIIASLLNVIMQELLMRGYLYQLWKEKYNIVIATIFTTALFTAMHAGAFEAGIIPVLNVVSMSIFVTLLLEYTETLIVPIIAHFIWNTVGAIILGSVSLASDYPNLLNSSFSGNTLITGGIYKIEGSIIVLIVNLSFIVILFLKMYMPRKIKIKKTKA